jgi:simple sugar transport system ATP-binding protein
MAVPIVEMIDIQKHFGHIIALSGVSFNVMPGECHCLLGDNGAGKSTFIKTMAGVHAPTHGEMKVNDKSVHFANPRDAMSAGIATVYQDLAVIPLMSVSRNFWMGREPERGMWPFRTMDFKMADRVAMQEMRHMGISLREPGQAVGTLSGGERQTVAMRGQFILARRFSFSTNLHRRSAYDKPQCSPPSIEFAKRALAWSPSSQRRHAMAVGDRFTVLNRGKTLGTADRGKISPDELQNLMAGGQELAQLESSLGGTV